MEMLTNTRKYEKIYTLVERNTRANLHLQFVEKRFEMMIRKITQFLNIPLHRAKS